MIGNTIDFFSKLGGDIVPSIEPNHYDWEYPAQTSASVGSLTSFN